MFHCLPNFIETKKTWEFFFYLTLVTLGGGGGGAGRRSHFLGDFFAAQKPFVCLKEAPKQTLCSLLTSDMLDIASNSMLKTSCTISGT